MPVDLSDPNLEDWQWDAAPLYCTTSTSGVKPSDAPSGAWRTSLGQWQYQDGSGAVYVSDDGRAWRVAKGTFPVGTVCDFFPLPRICSGCAAVNGNVSSGQMPTHVHEAQNGYSLVVLAEGGRDEAGKLTVIPDGGASVASAWSLGLPPSCDYGEFAFPKSCVDPVKNRRLQYGWVHGPFPGGFNGEEDAILDGVLTYKVNHQSLLREVTFDPRLGMLCFLPVEEMTLLRQEVLADIRTPTAVPAGGVLPLRTPPNVANQSEVRVSFTVPSVSVTFGVRVMASTGPCPGGVCPPRNFTSSGLDFAVAFTPPTSAGAAAWGVGVGSGLNPTVGRLPLLRTDEEIDIVVYVDHTVVEVFFAGGRYPLTAHVPTDLLLPHGGNTWQGVEIFASGAGVTVLNATVWRMADTWDDVRTHGRPNHRTSSAVNVRSILI